jgi:acyl-CoA reductase-like NAD-dependent aldehyde dehydrogenase
MNDVALLINGKSSAAQDGRSFDRLDPVKGTPVSSAAAASISDAHAAVEAAAAAFPAWSATGPGQRRELLLKSADALLARQGDFIQAMIGETGATEGWAGFNVAFAASILREAASMTTQIAGEVIPSDVPGNVAMAIRQPIGVCAAIAPWNAPVILGVRAIAMPLACGNTVVFKASETCPAVHRLIGTALHEAGIPDGMLNIITNAPEDAAEIVGALIDHPAVRHINFTGSTRVGRVIAERAARHLKPVLLELGGKAPLIVLEDADLDAAVDAAIFGAFMNQGQICMSTERIVVDEKVANDFVERLSRRAATLPLRDPSQGPAVLGSMVDARSAERVASLIEDAVGKGARIAAGGTGHGTLMPATVIDRVTSTMRIYAEESFGPVVTIVRVGGEDEAVRVANDTEYGLSAAIFSRDVARAWNLARQVQTGICHINGPTVHDEPQMPFGGVKASGYGRFGGKRGIDEFTTLRWITMQTVPRHYPF